MHRLLQPATAYWRAPRRLHQRNQPHLPAGHRKTGINVPRPGNTVRAVPNAGLSRGRRQRHVLLLARQEAKLDLLPSLVGGQARTRLRLRPPGNCPDLEH